MKTKKIDTAFITDYGDKEIFTQEYARRFSEKEIEDGIRDLNQNRTFTVDRVLVGEDITIFVFSR